MRANWVAKRHGHVNVSQMHYARQGVITEEMKRVAERENLGRRAALETAFARLNARIEGKALAGKEERQGERELRRKVAELERALAAGEGLDLKTPVKQRRAS